MHNDLTLDSIPVDQVQAGFYLVEGRGGGARCNIKLPPSLHPNNCMLCYGSYNTSQ